MLGVEPLRKPPFPCALLTDYVEQATEDLLAFTIRYTSGVICASLEKNRLEVRTYMCYWPLYRSLCKKRIFHPWP